MNRTKGLQDELNRLKQKLYLRLVACLTVLKTGALLRFIFMANILDGLLTLHWMNMKVADEANPLMAHLIEIDPNLFLGVKFAAVTISCLIFWRYHRLISAKIVIILSALLYASVLGLHVGGAIHADVLVMPTMIELRNAAFELWHRCVSWISTQIPQ
jgi:hypothetical protein